MEPIQFQSAKLKLRRAYHHFNELQVLLKDFFSTKAFFSVSCEAAGDLYVLKVKTGPDELPIEASLMLGDIIHNIRTAYDHMVISRTQMVGEIAFPIAKTLSDLILSNKNYLEIKNKFPDFADCIVRDFEPFQGGRLLIWEITQLDNLDKHNLLIPTVGVTQISDFKAKTAGGLEISNETIVFKLGQTVGHVALGAPLTITDKGKAIGTLLFGNSVLEGREILLTLKDCIHSAIKAVNALELLCYGNISDPNTLK